MYNDADAIDLDELDDVVLYDGMGLRDLALLVLEDEWRLPDADCVDTLIAIGGAFGRLIETNVRYRKLVNRMRYDEFCMTNGLQAAPLDLGTFSTVGVGSDGVCQGVTLCCDEDGPLWARHWVGAPAQRTRYEWSRDLGKIS